MEDHPPTQSKAAAIPAPKPGATASQAGPTASSSAPVVPLPSPLQRNVEGAAQPTAPVTIRLPLGPPPFLAAVGPALAEALDNRWQAYRKQLRRCQKESSEEAVHELRVATRRLLAQFVLLSQVAPSTALDKARRILKSRLVALSDLRDAQVQRLFLDQKAASFPETRPLRSWLARRERRLVKAAARKVKRFKTRKLEKWIAAMIEDLLANARRARAQRRFASAVLRSTAKSFAEAVRRRRAIDLDDLGTIHKTRIAFKRFRYMVESLSPAITGLSKRQLRSLAYYQRKMGIIQDQEVILRTVKRFLREHKKAEGSLRPFCRHLRQRRARALRSFLRTADRLYAFWPPAILAPPRESSLTRSAA